MPYPKAYLYILQVRGLSQLFKFDMVIILDNSNIVESYPNISLPLTSSIFAKEGLFWRI
jgi:pyruvate,water dikinase